MKLESEKEELEARIVRLQHIMAQNKFEHNARRKELEKKLEEEQCLHRETERKKRAIEREVKASMAQFEYIKRHLTNVMVELAEARAKNTVFDSLMPIPKRLHIFPSQPTQGAKLARKLYEEHKASLSFLLNNEKWQPVEVPAQLQEAVDAIVRRDSFAADENSRTESTPKSLRVAGEEFLAVGAVLLLVKTMSTFSAYAELYHFLTPHLHSRLVDLLQFYDFRVRSLLLGAEARKCAGLRIITVRHLALGLRSLQLIRRLIPSFHSRFLSLMDSKDDPDPIIQYSLEQVQMNFGVHCISISSRLVSILTFAFGYRLRYWQPEPPVPSATFRSRVCI
ncbi:unnamed protein product [Darwinula stevensoni]|uniref:Vacuolar protein sorting-associated protein 54 C-terminal domain-containing protein n=1 Tax=Darwinula stevensoni TaxID=69355 RepID=A0A7R9ADV7_9CRUS|nr:unnamed protein product [Darwinula stevensoni]CAG0901133.1 unnamed protein product [Darwinula stevensoni]